MSRCRPVGETLKLVKICSASMQERRPLSPQPTHQGRAAGHGPAILVLLLALAGIVLTGPILPAEWRGVTHLGASGNHTEALRGTIMIDSCSRGKLHFDWTCTGTFMTDNVKDDRKFPAIAVANDAGRLPRGWVVAAQYPYPGSSAYLYGTDEQLRILGFWAGILLLLGVLAGTAARWPRGRNDIWALIPLLLGLALALNPIVGWNPAASDDEGLTPPARSLARSIFSACSIFSAGLPIPNMNGLYVGEIPPTRIVANSGRPHRSSTASYRSDPIWHRYPDHERSYRSRFMTLSQAATKSRTKISRAPSPA